MGKGGSSKVAYQSAPVVTPAIARSISKDTQSAQALQQSDWICKRERQIAALRRSQRRAV